MLFENRETWTSAVECQILYCREMLPGATQYVLNYGTARVASKKGGD